MARNYEMENLINTINKIHDVFALSSMASNIDLPQIVVVGCQSAGKSSVLENIVGREFLPRGSGIVTRRPLILQLFTSNEEYGVFLHSNKRFYDFADIRNEIEAETNRTCADKVVSDVSINLKIYSPEVINLTLVDLPGLTKVAVGGQSEDIVRLIREMVLKFIEKENSLILAVNPANTDLANSDALQIAKEVDPSGLRTIGVITKLDLMDRDTNARDILENRVFKLQRGYVGVINRSQRDIDQKTPIEQIMAKEKQFFQNHPAYRHIADRMGTKYLQKSLNSQLMEHIMNVLPSLNAKISEQLSILGPQAKEIESKDKEMSHKSMMKIVTEFANQVYGSIMSTDSVSKMNTKILSAGVIINRCFFKNFPNNMMKIMNEDLDDLQKRIRISIQNVHGVKTGLSTPDMAFEIIIKSEIEKSFGPIKYCLDEVFNFASKNIEENIRNINEYPNLMYAVNSLIKENLSFFYNETMNQLELTVSFHKDYINTKHPDFLTNLTTEKSRRKGDNESLIFKKGHVTISNYSPLKYKGGNTFFVIVSTENIIIYKDEDEKDKKGSLSPYKLKYKVQSNIRDNLTISLVGNDPRDNLLKDLKQLDLQYQSYDECIEWLNSFEAVGLSAYDSQNQIMLDLENSARTVRDYVDSYKSVYLKIAFDIVPKIIYCCFLSKIVEYAKNDLIADLYSQGKINELLEQSAEAKVRKQEILTLYKTTKEASDFLRLIQSENPVTMRRNPIESQRESKNRSFKSPNSTLKHSFRKQENPESSQNSNMNPPSIPSRPRK